MKNRLIVVLGMHRSGTSAITRGLQVMGVGLGDRLLPPMEGVNPKGFLEDADLKDLNELILNALGSNWHYLAPIGPTEVDVLYKQGYFLSAVELLRKKMDAIPLFGFKDPRVAKLLPFWKEVIKHCELDASYVLAMRHPLSVIKSLSIRDGFDATKSYLLWLDHTIESLAGATDEKCILVDFDRLIRSPDHELKRISNKFNMEIDPKGLETYKAEFLDSKLRHTVYDLRDLILDEACPPLVRDIYSVLLKVASDEISLEDTGLQEKIAEWVVEHARLKPALMLFDRLYVQKMTAEQLIAEKKNIIDDLLNQVAEKEQTINGLLAQAAEKEQTISGLLTQAAEKERGVEAVLVQMAEKEQTVDILLAQVAEKESRIYEITSSKAWKVGLLFRKVRILLFPPKDYYKK